MIPDPRKDPGGSRRRGRTTVDRTGSITAGGKGNLNTGWQSILNINLVTPAVLWIAPPAVLLPVFSQSARDHVALSILICVAYLLLVGVIAIFRVPLTQSINRGTEATQRRLAGYGRQYLRWMQDSSNEMRTRYTDPLSYFTPKLGEIFVDVSVVRRAPAGVGDGLVDRAPESERRKIWEFIEPAEPRTIALLGVPGGGKTTLLRYICSELSTRSWRVKPVHRRRIPVLIELRKHADAILGGTELPAVVQAAIPPIRTSINVQEWWRDQLVKGRCVVLLDGFDEIVADEDRGAVASWINRQTVAFTRSKFVIASRAHGFQVHPPDRDLTVQVRSFTDDQVCTFLGNWYRAEAKSSGNVDPRRALAIAAAEADDLFSRLAGNPNLHDLTVNPLLLSMIVRVHRTGRLPESRVDLYAEVCRVTLNPPPETDPLGSRMSGHERLRALAKLAADFMRNRTTIEDLIRIRQVLRMINSPNGGITVEQFLDYAVRTGILVKDRQDRYSFAHLTFQEYLCARHLQFVPTQVRLLEEGIEDPWWQEVTLLWAPDGRADLVIKACLRSGSVVALSRAAACIDAAGHVNPALRQELDRLLAVAFLPTADRTHRRRVAGVLAMNHIRQSVASTQGSRIATTPVPAGLYWLYVTDTHAPEPDGECRPLLEPSLSATGMWGADAAGFVLWVNSLIDEASESPFRLPTSAELAGRRARLMLGSAQGGRPLVWHEDDAGDTAEDPGTKRVALWSDDGDLGPYIMSTGELITAVERDAASSPMLGRLLATALHARVLLMAESARLAHERAKRVARITHRAIEGGYRHASNVLQDLRSNHAPVEAVRHAQNDLAAWERALDRAQDNNLDIGKALQRFSQGNPQSRARPASDFERQEERQPARARLVAAMVRTLVESLDRIAQSFNRSEGFRLESGSTVEMKAVVSLLTDAHRRLAQAVADLHPQIYLDAVETIVGGHSRNAEAKDALSRTLGGLRKCNDQLANAEPAINALRASRWSLYLPSPVTLVESPFKRHVADVDIALLKILRPHMGEAVAKAIAAVIKHPAVDERVLFKSFARVLISRLRETEPTKILALDDLSDLLRNISHLDIPGAEPWARNAVGQIRGNLQPVLRRKRKMNGDRAAAIRTPAVALAVYAMQRTELSTAADALALAVGTTILEQRAARRGTAQEVILLAQD